MNASFGRFLFPLISLVCSTSAAFAAENPNAVGYVNSTLRPGFNLLANPLFQQGYTVASLTEAVQGTVPDGLSVYLLEDQEYRVAVFDARSAQFEPASVAAEPLIPGRGFFVYNPTPVNLTITFVGELMQGTLTNPLPAGFSMVGSMVPQGGTPEVLAFPAEPGDVIYRFDPAAQRFVVSVFDDIEGTWLPAVPRLDTGEGFIVYKRQPAVWTRVFFANYTLASVRHDY